MLDNIITQLQLQDEAKALTTVLNEIDYIFILTYKIIKINYVDTNTYIIILSHIRVRVSKVILTETISIRDTVKIFAVFAELGILYQIEY